MGALIAEVEVEAENAFETFLHSLRKSTVQTILRDWVRGLKDLFQKVYEETGELSHTLVA
jgi:hypothetical protein